MRKRKYSIDETTIQKRYKEGRGSGLLDKYTPWFYVHEVPSKGKSSIRKGWKTNRDHHLLSTLETKYFFTLEWMKEVIDIREQFPIPRSVTQQIASELGIKHPSDPSTNTDIVMTTDFVGTLKKRSRESIIARSVKYEKDIQKPRNAEKLLIEKEYWKRRGVDWAIISEKSIDENLVHNVRWIHKCFDLQGFFDSIDEARYYELCTVLPQMLKKMSHLSLHRITTQLDQEYHLRTGITLSLVKHIIAHRKINVDMHQRINPDKPLILC